MSRPIGQRLDALGVTASIGDEEFIDSAVVVSRVVGADGRSRVNVAWTDGQDFVTRRGLLEVARDGEVVRAGDLEGDGRGDK